ncbi:hypothetical protein BKG96_08130 [Rodentibacter caecimuris]|uniref:Uncharacterized protein n=1 Tax=Rodentibacter caecimuris TaxID=1796644 RepID=A0A1V3KIU8_9PAST|nr:hypothetical protein [Rodentibacter heylii]OOF77579.1 hypothetical protein BKG96_08130 [Rodentibacter heylii]
MSTTLKVLSAKKVIASHQITQGEMLVIEARDKSNYQLIDDQTGLGPQNIIAKREGKDLKLFLEDGDMSADVVIKGYYGDENSEEVSNLIVGQHENGGIYAYVPESGLKSDAVSMLAEEVAAPQALGGEDLASAFWAFNPWWLLALVPLAAGIAIAASNGGSSGGGNENADNTADKPTLDAKADGSVTVKPGADNTKVVVKYTDEDGTEKTATLTKDADGNWTSDNPDVTPKSDGTFTIPADKVKDGSKVTAIGTDDKGNAADADAATAGNNPDTTADKPTLTPETDGSVSVKPGEDNTKVVVKYTDEDGTEKIATLTKDADGNWTSDNPDVTPKNDGTFTIPANKVKDGSEVTAIGTDDKGNVADADVATAGNNPDTTADKPTLTPETDGSVSVKSGEDNTKVVVKYTTDEDGTEKTATLTKDADGNWISDNPDVTPKNDGTFTIPADKVKDGSKVTAVGTDDKGNVADADVATAGNNPDTTADKPTLTPETDGSVSVKSGEDNTKVVVKYTDEDGTEKTATLTKDADGNWTSDNPDVTPKNDGTFTIPADKVKDGSEVTAIGTDDKGNAADADAATAGNNPDTTADKPTLTAETNGSVSVKSGEDNTKVVVKYTDEDGTEKTATLTKDADGNWISDNPDVTPKNDGTFTIPADKVKDGSEVTAIGTDDKGNAADADAATAGNNPDTTADKPTLTAETDGSVSVKSGEDNTKVVVKYTDEDGTEKTATLTKDADGNWISDNPDVTPKNDGTFTIPADKVKDGSEVTAIGTDDKGNAADADAATAGNNPDTTADKPTLTAETDGSVSVKPGEDNTKVVVKYTDEDGTEKNATLTKDADGNWTSDNPDVTPKNDGSFTIPENKVKDGSEVTAIGTDDKGNAADADATAGNNPNTTADKPVITAENDGSVTVKPGDDNVIVGINFKDENDKNQSVAIQKENGKWRLLLDTGVGATVDKDSGIVTISADKLKDGGEVNAIGRDDFSNGNWADADPVNAGSDPKNAKPITEDKDRDGTPDGVVSSPAAIDETGNNNKVTTTIKLDNNNGVDNLPITIVGTGGKPVSAEDFEAPVVKYTDPTDNTEKVLAPNAYGTYNVPAGVTELKVEHTAKADNSTEGAETGKVKVGNVEGNEVTVNDTSKQDTTPTIDINNIAGQAQVAEGTDGYAQFLPSNVTTEEISNTTENGVTTIVKGFTVSGTTTNVPDGTDVAVTIVDSKGAVYYDTYVGVTGGTWSIKVPVETTTITVTGSGEDELTETQTTYHYPKFDTEYRVLATVNANGSEVTDEDKIESAPVVTDIYLQDTLTDDAPNVADFYTNTDKYVGRIDGMTDTDATKAISRQTGLTNDPSAALHFTLDKEPKAGQTVKVLRYKLIDGAEAAVEDLTAQMTNNGLNYTVKPTTPQSETTNQLYRYKVVVEDAQGFDLSEKNLTYRLDTIVEAMDVKELNSDTNTMILQADGISEIGATIKYKYQTGTGESALKSATDNGDGTYTLSLDNWNRKVAGSITLQVIDAAGNVSETKINAVRNLYDNYTEEMGLDPNGSRFDKASPTLARQQSATGDKGGFVATEGNDTLIVGLDNFGAMGLENGSVARNITVGAQVHIEMGKGDDHIQVRGDVQSMGSDADGYFDMGEGNDKITFGGAFVIGNYNIRMGEGNNVLNFGGTTVQAAGLDISYGNGNDVLRADVNKDFSGTKKINFGDGDNYMEVGNMHDKNEITFGNGNDVFIAKTIGTKAPASGVIDMGDGNDIFSVSGLFARQEAKLGAGDDVAIMGDRIETGAAYGRLDGGDGNDTLVLTKSNGKVSLQNVLNFEVIDLTVPTAQTIGISKDYITQANDTTKAIYIKGGTNDTVDFGDNGKYINGTKFKDGGGAIKANWNFWEKTESDVVHDGVTYDKYTYRAADGSVNDEAIYIQQGIQII